MRTLHLILAALVVLIWGFNFVVIQLGLEQISPLMLCSTRFFLTSIPAVFFIKRPSVPLKKVAMYAFVMFTLQFAFLFSGMYEGIPAGLASLLTQSQVFFAILLAHFFFNERLNRWQVLGMCLAFSGIALVGRSLTGSVSLLGFALVLAAAATWAYGNSLIKKMGKTNMTAVVIWASLFAWPPLLIGSLLLDGPTQIFDTFSNLSWISIGSILYIGYLSTLLCFIIWNFLLREYKLSTVSPFTLLVPIVGVGGSILVFDEPLQTWKIVAAFLVIGGLCFHLFGPRLARKKRF